MSQRLTRMLDAALRRSPAQPLFRWRVERALAVLAYHDIRDPLRFGQQMELLARAMHPVALDDLLAGLAGGRALPRRAVLVTFDDGDRSVYEHALPILRQNGIPAVCFVVAGLLDSEQPGWWLEVEELVRRGARAGALPAQGPAACVATLKRLPDEERLQVIEELRRDAPGDPVRPCNSGAPSCASSRQRECGSAIIR